MVVVVVGASVVVVVVVGASVVVVVVVVGASVVVVVVVVVGQAPILAEDTPGVGGITNVSTQAQTYTVLKLPTVAFVRIPPHA